MKKCNWCTSEVDEKAKMCPKCGKAIWDKKDKKRIKTVFLTFGIIFMVLFIVIIALAVSSPGVEDKCKNAELVNLEDIYNLHAQNVPKAEELYKDKYFKFNGKVSHIYKKYLQIDSEYISADVYFGPNYEEKAKNLNVNDSITYCGKVEFGMSINIKNAMIIEESN